jgi:uncharacterized coiled-coil protein SlyX
MSAILATPASTASENDQSYVVLSTAMGRWKRGDVFSGETYREALKLATDVADSEIDRLVCSQAIRLATPHEAEQSRVCLTGQDDRHVSLETRLLQKESEITRLRARVAELEALVARTRQEQMLLPGAVAGSGQAALIKEKDSLVIDLQRQVTALTAELAASRQASLPAVQFTPAPPPAVSTPTVSVPLDPTIPPPPARSPEARSLDARTSRRA